jgi:protein-tyrosine-phosphatase
MNQERRSPVLRDYPYPRTNVFVMMRFGGSPQHTQIFDAVQTELSRYGLNALRADGKTYVDTLWANVTAYIEACDFGIAVFEQIAERDFNPNVSLELGYMMAKGKQVLLLKEARLPSLHSDVVGRLYKSFDAFDIGTTVSAAIRGWLRDIGVAKSRGERLVIFVSYGGTCRCAMAKVVLSQALRGRHLPYRLRTQSIAHAFGSAGTASGAAREVVKQIYGSDLLADHVVTQRHPAIIEDADLILVMERKLLEGLPSEKTYVFNEFFGLTGDVLDPWPPDNSGAHERYLECLHHLRSVIDSRVEKVVVHLNKLGAA